MSENSKNGLVKNCVGVVLSSCMGVVSSYVGVVSNCVGVVLSSHVGVIAKHVTLCECGLDFFFVCVCVCGHVLCG